MYHNAHSNMYVLLLNFAMYITLNIQMVIEYLSDSHFDEYAKFVRKHNLPTPEEIKESEENLQKQRIEKLKAKHNINILNKYYYNFYINYIYVKNNTNMSKYQTTKK